MSIGAINWALEQDVRPPACKFLQVILANWCDPDHFTYPGDEAIAEKASLRCTKTVRAHIEALVRAGLIRHGKGYDREGQIRDGYILACPSRAGKTFPAPEKNSKSPENISDKSEKFSAPIDDTKLTQKRHNAREAAPPQATASARSAQRAVDLWDQHRERIESDLGKRVWDGWLSELAPLRDTGKTLELTVPSPFMAAKIQGEFAEALSKILDRKIVVHAGYSMRQVVSAR